MQGSADSPAATASAVVITERPPEGLGQGVYAFPGWGIATLGGLLVAASVAYLVLRRRGEHRS